MKEYRLELKGEDIKKGEPHSVCFLHYLKKRPYMTFWNTDNVGEADRMSRLFFSIVGSLWQLWAQAVLAKSEWQAECWGADRLSTFIGRYRCGMHHRSVLQLQTENRVVINTLPGDTGQPEDVGWLLNFIELKTHQTRGPAHQHFKLGSVNVETCHYSCFG